MVDATATSSQRSAPRSEDADFTGAVTVSDLKKDFGTGAQKRVVLDQISLQLAAGKFTAFVGPSGCGKTTMLRILAGLEAASTGSVSIDGASPEQHRQAHDLAIAFQDPALLPWRSVVDNVRLPVELAKGRHPARRPEVSAKIDELIELVGLQSFRSARPGQLSGGMRQRCAIARALVMEPSLLLLDEPFASVDEITRRKLNADLLNLLRERRHSTVLVTHSIFEAVLLADAIVVFSARPARVVDIVSVDLPSDRNLELSRSPEFADLVNRTTDCLLTGSEWAVQ